MQNVYQPFQLSTFDKIKLFLLGSNSNLVNKFIKEWQVKEKIFFDLTKVNQAITIIGMTPELQQHRDSNFYSYDENTLKLLGVNIKFEDKQVELDKEESKQVQIFEISEPALKIILKQHNQLLK